MQDTRAADPSRDGHTTARFGMTVLAKAAGHGRLPPSMTEVFREVLDGWEGQCRMNLLRVDIRCARAHPARGGRGA